MTCYRSGEILILVTVLVAVLIRCDVVGGAKNYEPKWWNLATIGDPSNTISNHIKSNAVSSFRFYLEPGIARLLKKRQLRLVRENPGILLALTKGTQMSTQECKYHFRGRRWDCPQENNHNKSRGGVFGPIVSVDCRETAFLYALTSAALTHSVTRSCTEGGIASCACDYRPQGFLEGDWKWGGCSENIDFGAAFAQEFTDAAEGGRNRARLAVNVHNNQAGRMMVMNDMRKECKCIGMSGSCTFKTCWKRLPELRKVVHNIKDRFDGASRVRYLPVEPNDLQNDKRRNRKGRNSPWLKNERPKGALRPYHSDHKPPTDEDLVYLNESPDFCAKNKKLDFKGTRGRHCNETSLGVDGCDLMCCARGFNSRWVEVEERCACNFHWCCHVQCSVCRFKKHVHTCL